MGVQPSQAIRVVAMPEVKSVLRVERTILSALWASRTNLIDILCIPVLACVRGRDLGIFMQCEMWEYRITMPSNINDSRT